MNNHVVLPVFRLGRSRFSRCLLACGMLAALAAVLAGCTKQVPALSHNLWERGDYMLSLDQGLLGSLEDQSRWALAANAAHAPLPNLLEYIDARPLQSARPNAVSILLP